MVGQGVLRECLLDAEIDDVLTIGRSATGIRDAKLREIVRGDLWDFSGIEGELRGLDACFYCLGVSSSGMAEGEYERLTYGLTMAAAEPLSRLNPGMTFVFVSGAGSDSSEQGRVMWARVKGKAENAVMRLPFKTAYVFRPAAIQPVHGEKSRTAAYRILYSLTRPLLPLLRRMFPRYILTTEEIGLAMIAVVRRGAPKRILESGDIGDCVRGAAGRG